MQLQLNYFDFSGLPGRKNNLPALDARRAWKSLSPETDTDDLNSFKSSSEKKNNLFVIHCSRNSYMEWHRFVLFKEQLHGMAPIFLNLLIMFLFLISLSLNGNGLFRIPRFIS